MTSSDASARRPLRVGFFVDAPEAPRWIYRLVEAVVALPECALAFVSFDADAPRASSLLSRVARAPDRALFECFRALDDRVFGRPDDARATRDLRPLLGATPRAPDDSDELDVILRLGRAAPAPSLVARARGGVWSLRFGPRTLDDPSAAGLYEVLSGAGTVTTELFAAAREGSPERVVARAVTRADVRSVRRGQGVFLAKTAALVAHALRALYDDKLGATDPEALEPRPSAALASGPTNGELSRLLVGHGLRYLDERVDRAMYATQWVLAWQRSESLSGAAPFRYLLPPGDRFWADPFPSVRGGRRHIFFEEAILATGKGHISLVELRDDGSHGEVERVLERPHHLSYPFLLRHGGDDFMLPEGSVDGGVGVYRARRFPRGWELVDVLLPDRFVSDATLREIDGRWWLFADIAVDGTRVPSEELHLFYGPTPFGPWTPHRRNPITSDAGRARPAGAVFAHTGKLYRPAQDCATRYGYAVSFNEIVRLTPDDYAEVERGRMTPSWDPRLLATHTFNRDGDLTVIDAVMRRPASLRTGRCLRG